MSPAAAEIDFWFDVVSPCGDFAAPRIDATAARHGRTARWFGLPWRSGGLASFHSSKASRAFLQIDELDREAAVAAGVWGTPSLVVDGELFCGADRLGLVDEWLQRGGW